MKNKYKLIKEYPGSPRLGTIAEKDNSWTIGGFSTIYNIENYPEFWEEVIEKDYEILSFKTSCGIISKTDALWYSCEEAFYTNKGCTIHSVKRLSDGEVFSVGDKFNLGVIDKIVVDNVSVTFYDKSGSSSGLYVTHKRKLIFTTEDGVDIYDGEHVFVINNEQIIRCKVDGCKPNYSKTFLTVKAAREYILMNKPCLSINDFIEANYGVDESEVLDILKELVKQKIK